MAVKSSMFLTATQNSGQESGIFNAILVGFADSCLCFSLLAFIGGKTAVFSRREQVVGGVKKLNLSFLTPRISIPAGPLRAGIFLSCGG